MTCDPSIESKNPATLFAKQADGVLVLAYDGGSGACGEQLLKLLEEIADSLPVLVVQTTGHSDRGKDFRFQGKDSRVVAVPAVCGQTQNTAIASAMRDMGIKAPILVLVNPLFIPFWEHAFAVYRCFVPTPAFKRETATAQQEDEDFDRKLRNQILLLERSVNSILIEAEDDLEWMREEFVYRGKSYRVQDLQGSAVPKLQELSKNTLVEDSRFPHRLDILILVDPPEDRSSLPDENAAVGYQRFSRHRIYFALKHAKEESEKLTLPPDYSEFDVLLIEQLADDGEDGNMDPQVASAAKHFRGLKGILADGENWTDETLVDLADHIGAQILVSRQALEEGQNPAQSLDTFFSRLMPGLPNWQLHQAGKFLPHMAWTYGQLLERHANGELDLDSQIDPIGELRSIDLEKQKLEGKLEKMRSEIASLDGEILNLQEKVAASQKRKPGFLKKILSGIKGKHNL